MNNMSEFITKQSQFRRLTEIIQHATNLKTSIMTLNDSTSDPFHGLMGESTDTIYKMTKDTQHYLGKILLNNNVPIGYIVLGPYDSLLPEELSIIGAELILMSHIDRLPSQILRTASIPSNNFLSNDLNLVNTLEHYDFINVIHSISESLKSDDYLSTEALIAELFRIFSTNKNIITYDLLKYYIIFAFSSITFDLIAAGYHLDLNVLVLHNFMINISAITSTEKLEEYCIEFYHSYFDERKKRNMTNYPYPVNNVIKSIKQFFQSELTLSSVAMDLGYSQRHLARLIKASTQETFLSLLTKERIAYAKLLLKDNKTSIAEVSSASGFKSVSRFYSVFKKHESITPSQYRRENEK